MALGGLGVLPRGLTREVAPREAGCEEAPDLGRPSRPRDEGLEARGGDGVLPRDLIADLAVGRTGNGTLSWNETIRRGGWLCGRRQPKRGGPGTRIVGT